MPLDEHEASLTSNTDDSVKIPSIGSQSSGGSQNLSEFPKSSISTNQPTSSSAIIVEAVLLLTRVGERVFSRTVYASPMALATRLVPPELCDFDEILHVFADTHISFQFIIRVLGDEEASPLRVFCHEANINDLAVEKLLVFNIGTLIPCNLDSRSAYLLKLPESKIQATDLSNEQLLKRLQIFDQERRLVFTKEWKIEIGILNDDAISWLGELNCSLASLLEGGNESSNRSTPLINQLHYRVVEQERKRSSSVTSSFIDLEDGDGQFEGISHRSGSTITLGSQDESDPASGGGGVSSSPQAVDMFYQLGFWLYGTRIGQLVASPGPWENRKTIYSRSSIWLMGVQFKNDQGAGSPIVITLDNIAKLVPCQGVFDPVGGLKSTNSQNNILEHFSYSLRETLIFTHFIPETIIPLLSSWIETHQWVCSYRQEGERISLECKKESCELLLIIEVFPAPNNGRFIFDSIIYSDRGDSKIARTTLVDVISQTTHYCFLYGYKGTLVELAFLANVGCSIDIGPHPNNLTPLSNLVIDDTFDSESSQLGQNLTVYLWSEHVHDWILRVLTLEESVEPPYLTISSSLLEISAPLKFNLHAISIFTFEDGSLRFAISRSSSWLCLRCLNLRDYNLLMKRFIDILVGPKQLTDSGKVCHSITTSSTSPVKLYNSPKSSPRSSRSMISGRPSSLRIKSDNVYGMEAFLNTFESLFWFTYRKDFVRLPRSILSSDVGFGCMIRAGQSMIAEVLYRLEFGFPRKLADLIKTEESKSRYSQILNLFLDSPESERIFSVHNIVRVGVELGTPLGQYFAPSILARAFRRQCRNTPQGLNLPLEIMLCKNGIINIPCIKAALDEKPQVLLLPLRLGAESLNCSYSSLIKRSLSIPYSVGIVGGRKNRAFYIVGFQDESLLYLDPHYLRPANLNMEKIIESMDYHTRIVCELSLPELDPTMLFGFLLREPKDIDSLVEYLVKITIPMPLFTVFY